MTTTTQRPPWMDNRPAMETAWMKDRRCRGLDPELFFPARGAGEDVRAAKAVCAECPVRKECLQYALDNGEVFGVWGGESTAQRKRRRHPTRVICVMCHDVFSRPYGARGATATCSDECNVARIRRNKLRRYR